MFSSAVYSVVAYFINFVFLFSILLYTCKDYDQTWHSGGLRVQSNIVCVKHVLKFFQKRLLETAMVVSIGTMRSWETCRKSVS